MGQQVFVVTPRLLQRHGWTFDDLDLIAVGRGPGSYTGLRMAISYAQGLALPRATPLHAVKSSEALAAELAESHAAPHFFVVGDARRGTLWVHEFERCPGNVVRSVREFGMAAEESASLLTADVLAASPDWDRLVAAHIVERDDPRWGAENRYPRAAFVGMLAARRAQAGIPSEPLLPIYPTFCS